MDGSAGLSFGSSALAAQATCLRFAAEEGPPHAGGPRRCGPPWIPSAAPPPKRWPDLPPNDCALADCAFDKPGPCTERVPMEGCGAMAVVEADGP